MTSRSIRFRALFDEDPFVCMEAHDALTARIAEDAGAKAIFHVFNRFIDETTGSETIPPTQT